MIIAEFYLKDETIVGFSVRGHAGFADYGNDIVCAGVTSAVELTANGITEIVNDKTVSVAADENEVKLTVCGMPQNETSILLKSLRLHLELLSKSYSKHLKIVDVEV